MAYTPIVRTLLQYVDLNGDPYSGAVLKAYKENTSTPIDFATDNTGTVLVDSIALNAAGYTEVSGNPIIPHIQENYKLALYPDQDSADSNTGELWIIDNIIFSDFGGGELTDILDGTARTSAINIGQVQDSTLTNLGITGGAADAYELSPSIAITAYVSTQEFTVQIHATNLTTTPYLQISSIAFPSINAVIKRFDSGNNISILGIGDLRIDGIYKFKRDSTNNYWIVLFPVYASETKLGVAEIATQTEVDAGTDNTKIVTPLKLASSSVGRLISIQTFTSSGTWTKPTGVNSVLVEVQAGGGGAGGGASGGTAGTGGAGGTSSFGSFCSAAGGSGGFGAGGTSGVGNGGGIGIDGAINLRGSPGMTGSVGGASFFCGGGNLSIEGVLGGGGGGGIGINGVGGGGGAGGYAKKLIFSGLGDTETVTIGSGGGGGSQSGGANDGGAGGDGIIVVYEYN